ncbi:hypothetical protein ACFQAT_08375 [Undibacterium arcticum]|uniref:hypothetical protein n=1 Tax=Undibacterium arcticum TaxID=1762892 RepID=UPI0036185423
MPFEKKIKDEIIVYVTRDIANEPWHVDFFRFISDQKLAQRLGEEFISTRCLYKILEGLDVTKWMLRAQVRQQIMSYASIYEAALHHLLFEVCSRSKSYRVRAADWKKRYIYSREQTRVAQIPLKS